MDLNQLSQMVGWLDEEHRRDREELARLDQRLQNMAVERQEQARRIQDLEGRLASTQAQLSRFTQMEQAMQQLKAEVIVLLDKATEARLTHERETERARMNDRENANRVIGEIRKELGRLPRFEEELQARHTEDQRLSEMLLALRISVNNLGKDMDERTRSLPYMVEQRSQDNKRIAQIQADSVELAKRTEALSGRMPTFEERIQRLEKALQRIQPIPEQLREQQQTFMDAQRLVDVDRERQMVLWEQDLAQQKELMEKHSAKMRLFEARYEAADRALKALDDFQTQLIRDQKQLAELQRLAEERQRKELADAHAENEQRWKKEAVRWEYALQEQQKVNGRFADRFPPIEKHLGLIQREVEALWRVHEALSSLQLQESQRMLDAVGAAMGSRPKPEA